MGTRCRASRRGGRIVRVETILDGTGQESVGIDDVPVIVYVIIVIVVVDVPPFCCRC